MNFSMQIPDTDALIREVKEEVRVAPEELDALLAKTSDTTDPLLIQAKTNAVSIMNCDFTSLQSRQMVLQPIEQFGMDTMHKSSNKNTLLKATIAKLSNSGSEGGEVSKSLMTLSREIKNLDPGPIDFTKTGFLGKIFNPVRDYFARFEKADDVIDDILQSLDRGKTTLKNDNVTLALEQQSLRELTKKLGKEIELGSVMDGCLTEQIENEKINGNDPERISFVEEEILFPLRQRIMDMQSLIVVNQQGIVAMEIIQRNNKELIRGVDRAKVVTVTALRTAVMVASALYNQRIVLQKLQILNETTNNLISSTSKMLKDQGTAVHKQSLESNISIDTLKTSFADVMAAMEEISSFKRNALPMLQNQINQFRELADKGEATIQRIENGRQFSLTDNSN